MLAQSVNEIWKTSDAQHDQEELFRNYLYGKGSIDQKLKELVDQAREVEAKGDIAGAMLRFHIGFLLEKNARPSIATFDLNFAAGLMIRNINYQYALEFFEKATRIQRQLKDLDHARIFQLYTNRAGSHLELNEPDSAKYYYLAAVEQAKFDNHVTEASSLNNLGIFFSKINEIDSARAYFARALHRLGNRDLHITLYSSITDNVAHLDLRDDQYQKAIPVFLFNDSIYYSEGGHEQYVVNKVKLLKALDHVDDEAVTQHIDQIRNYLELHREKIRDKFVFDFYEFANDYYFKENDRNRQVYYREQFRKLGKTLETQNLDNFNALTQSLYKIQEASLKADINAYQSRTEKQKLQLRNTIIIAITAVVSACIIIVLLIANNRKDRKQQLVSSQLVESELRAKEMEARLLQQDLELKKRDLTNIVLHNTQVYDSNQKIIERLGDISAQQNVRDEVRTLLNDLQVQNQVSERTIALQANIESVNEEFFEKLKEHYPNLTKSEVELCGYIRINLSSKDISILKNVAPESVKMSRNRLRKKLGISAEEDIYQFIKSL
jgi:DNA-binding CsgD family transcriptional regulator